MQDKTLLRGLFLFLVVCCGVALMSHMYRAHGQTASDPNIGGRAFNNSQVSRTVPTTQGLRAGASDPTVGEGRRTHSSFDNASDGQSALRPAAPAQVTNELSVTSKSAAAASHEAFSASNLAFVERECLGQVVPNCRVLFGLLAPERQSSEGEEAISSHLEREIVADLGSVAVENHFSQVDAKCMEDACIFLVAAKDSTQLPNRGDADWQVAFERWLMHRAWFSEFSPSVNTSSMRDLAEYRVVGSDSEPYRIWYVLPRHR